MVEISAYPLCLLVAGFFFLHLQKIETFPELVGEPAVIFNPVKKPVKLNIFC